MKLSKTIRPAKQGDFDGACGFYAIANALFLLLGDQGQSKDTIFNTLYQAFYTLNTPDDRNKAYKFMQEGIDGNELATLVKKTGKHLAIKNVKIKLHQITPSQIITTAALHKQLQHHLVDDKTVAIVAFEYGKQENNRDYYNHWVVIYSITPKTFKTFDGFISRIAINQCGVKPSLVYQDEYIATPLKPFTISRSNVYIISTSC